MKVVERVSVGLDGKHAVNKGETWQCSLIDQSLTSTRVESDPMH